LFDEPAGWIFPLRTIRPAGAESAQSPITFPKELSMSRSMICSCAVAIVILLSMTAPPAAAADKVSMAAADKVSTKDQKFVNDAALGGMLEVKLGEIAAKNAEDADVKAFGEMMVTDHTKANDELKSLAQSKGISVPAELDEKHQKMLDRMSRKTGAAFDRSYMKDMVSDHIKDVKEFATASEKADDADIKAFAAKTLPTLKEHLKKAREVNKALRGGASAQKPADGH
jgi:putative membrane protein